MSCMFSIQGLRLLCQQGTKLPHQRGLEDGEPLAARGLCHDLVGRPHLPHLQHCSGIRCVHDTQHTCDAPRRSGSDGTLKQPRASRRCHVATAYKAIDHRLACLCSQAVKAETRATQAKSLTCVCTFALIAWQKASSGRTQNGFSICQGVPPENQPHPVVLGTEPVAAEQKNIDLSGGAANKSATSRLGRVWR